MSRRKEVLFHLTPYENKTRVMRNGLSVSRDRRGKGRIWLCDWPRVRLVAEHLTGIRKLTYADWAVIEVFVEDLPQIPSSHGRPGIYYVTRDIPGHVLRLQRVRIDCEGLPVSCLLIQE